jgi:endonuclease IV
MIKDFTVHAGHTINLGNFENLKIEASVTFTVEDGEDFAVIKVRAQQDLRALLEETFRAQRSKMRT